MVALVDITTDPLSIDTAIRHVQSPEAGGIVVFLGTVRNATSGRKVSRLFYESYDAMARQEMDRLCRQAAERFGIGRAAILHRTGPLEIGDTSIVVAASSAHRAEAFAAARFLIDELKRCVPIWKKEIFEDGEAAWIQGA